MYRIIYSYMYYMYTLPAILYLLYLNITHTRAHSHSPQFCVSEILYI